MSSGISFLLGGSNQEVLQTLNPTTDYSAIGVFNVAATKYGASPSASPAANLAAFEAAEADRAAAGVGTLMIPNLGAPYSLGGGALNMSGAPGEVLGIGKPILAKYDTTPCFNFSGATDFRGVKLSNLKIGYTNANAAGTAIYTANCTKIEARDIHFSDCIALFADNQSLMCGLEDCFVSNTKWNNIVLVTLQGPQEFVRNCIIQQQPIHTGGPTGGTGILVTTATDARISDTQILDIPISTQVGTGAYRIDFDNITCQAYDRAVLIQPGGSTGQIYVVKYAKCFFVLTNNSALTDALVYVDTNGGVQANVDDVTFEECTAEQGLGAGYQFNAGQNIRLLGGSSRGNVTAGVLITGAAVKARGHDSLGAYPGQGSASQQYGYSITSGSLFAIGCDLSGNTAAALHDPSSLSRLVACPPVN